MRPVRATCKFEAEVDRLLTFFWVWRGFYPPPPESFGSKAKRQILMGQGPCKSLWQVVVGNERSEPYGVRRIATHSVSTPTHFESVGCT